MKCTFTGVFQPVGQKHANWASKKINEANHKVMSTSVVNSDPPQK